MKTKEDIIELIETDIGMMDILRAAKTLNLPDWWICAGFVRSKIWDHLHGYTERTSTPDVDVIYFDQNSMEESVEKGLEEKLREILPKVPWSVKNEARMHVVNNILPYTSSVDAISKFPETATALGVKLDEQDRVNLTAPCGIEDVLQLKLKPTPYFSKTEELAAIYEERVVKKNWKSKWHKIEVFHTY
ncbi:nucleotidyltransferase family protein [Bacillus carboniphilus]|uniref:Nucleotidyltransferase family protein n=1 Tax=Bacillus carboniphilus TaxID=86663 RepID=A0ABP3GEI3_9BACI